jgi:hypothetical protein
LGLIDIASIRQAQALLDKAKQIQAAKWPGFAPGHFLLADACPRPDSKSW